MIRDVAQVSVLRTPARYRILSAMQELGQCSVKELAAWIGWRPASLYYHVKALQDAGLVVNVGSRRAGPRGEAIYAPVAREIRIDPRKRSAQFLAALWDAYRAVLRASERYLQRALRAERHESGARKNAMVLETRARMSPAGLARLRSELLRLHNGACRVSPSRKGAGVYLVSVCVRTGLPRRRPSARSR